MGGLWMETAQTARALARRPGFTSLAVGTLGLGLGFATAMFALVNAVLLRPLGYPEPDRVVGVFLTIPSLGWERGPVSYPNFDDARRRSRAVFESLSAYQTGARRVLVLEGEEPRVVRGSVASGDLFTTLGRAPLLGRVFERADEGAEDRVVVLSHALWTNTFGADRSVVGRTLQLSGVPHQLVGVMTADFPGPAQGDEFWLPFPPAAVASDRDSNSMLMIGRLRAGVSEERAQAEMADIFAQLRREHPVLATEDRQVRVIPQVEVLTGDVSTQMYVLLGAVALLLVIACANLAGLLLVRGIARGREIALKEALGASRARLIRGLLTESLLLAAAGAALAIPVAALVLKGVLALGPADLPRRSEIALGPLSVLVCAGLALLCAVAYGAVPALQSVRQRATGTGELAIGARATGDARTRLQHGLVVVQIALATVLLIGSSLLGLSFVRLQRADPGFVSEGALTFHITPPTGAYTETDELLAFHGRILEGLQAMPGVTAAGATWALPLGEAYGSSGYVPEGRPGSESLGVEITTVTGDYMQAMGMRLVAGRLVEPEDAGGTEIGIVVSESLARRAWPGLNPIGRVLVEDDDPDERLRVVGVVAEVAMRGVDGQPALMSFWPWVGQPYARSLYYVARVDGDPLALLPAVRELVRRVDSRVPVADIATMSERMSRHFAEPRFRTLLVGLFGLGAALLSLLGIYGVISFSVGRRTRELGVRLALGAQKRGLLLAVLRRGAGLALLGTAIGLAVAVAGARVLEGMLFGVAPLSWPVYAGVSVLVILAATAACWLPARRAATVSPTAALASE